MQSAICAFYLYESVYIIASMISSSVFEFLKTEKIVAQAAYPERTGFIGKPVTEMTTQCLAQNSFFVGVFAQFSVSGTADKMYMHLCVFVWSSYIDVIYVERLSNFRQVDFVVILWFYGGFFGVI